MMDDQNKRPAAVASDTEEDLPYFIPSLTWQGPRPGYYFGTSDPGTGYYQDSTAASTTFLPTKKRKTTTTEQLLEQAEQKAENTRIVILSVPGVQQAAAALHRAVETNSVRRAANTANPRHYMDSEVALYEYVAALGSIAVNPEELYPVICANGTLVPDLLQLLLHDNTDIVVAVTSVWLEWLGDDWGEIQLEAVKELGRVFLAGGGAEALVENLGRLNSQQASDDEDDTDGGGSADIMTFFQNLLDLDEMIEEGFLESSSVAKKLCRDTALMPWLLSRVADQSQQAGRAIELLSSLVTVEDVHETIENWSIISGYSSGFVNEGAESSSVDAIEIMLQTVAKFKKRQPSDPDQVELLENAAVVMGSILTYSPASLQAFVDAQGMELVLRCLKERAFSAAVTLKWLDFDNSHAAYKTACEHLVDAGGYKHLFSIFLGKHLPKHHDPKVDKKEKRAFVSGVQETVIRILYGLVRHLQKEDPLERRERLLAKFSEEKIIRLVDLLIDYDQKTRIAEYKFFKSEIEDDLDEEMVPLAVIEAKMEAGGDVLHRLAAITAFCCAGSKNSHSLVLTELHKKKSGMVVIQGALEEFISVLQEGSESKRQLQSFLDEI